MTNFVIYVVYNYNNKRCCMTKTEFVEKAKKLGYTNGWI